MRSPSNLIMRNGESQLLMIHRSAALPAHDVLSENRICIVWSTKSALDRTLEVHALIHRLYNEEHGSCRDQHYLIAEDLSRLSAGLLQIVEDQLWDLVREIIPTMKDLLQVFVAAHPDWAQRREIDLIRRKLDAIRSWIN